MSQLDSDSEFAVIMPGKAAIPAFRSIEFNAEGSLLPFADSSLAEGTGSLKCSTLLCLTKARAGDERRSPEAHYSPVMLLVQLASSAKTLPTEASVYEEVPFCQCIGCRAKVVFNLRCPLI